MRQLFLLSFLIAWITASAQNKRPIPVIFDTDIAGDYDDVGAMALLHSFAAEGDIKILATISCNAFETTGPTLSLINNYFGAPDIPIGVTKRKAPYKDCPQLWAQAILNKYPHALKSNDDAVDAVKLYRKILSASDDHSVVIITVGFFTNLSDLFDTAPDEYSSLSGKDLIAKKVKRVVSMATGMEEGKKSGREYNVYVDVESAKKFFAVWNTPVFLSPFEVGEKIHTGIRLINSDSITNSPVKEAYSIALTKDRNTIGRCSWDQTAVLVAAKGVDPYFNVTMLNMKITNDGTNVIIPGKRFHYLSLKHPPEIVAKVIEEYMMKQPSKQ